MLVHKSDLQSILYLFAYPALLAYQWQKGFSPVLYALALLISVGIGVIHHNHTHLPMWRSPALNRITSYLLSLLQGCPSFVFYPAHIENHHRYNHGPLDEARTYRFGGDHNHLAGYLSHPFQAVYALRKVLQKGIWIDRQESPIRFRDTCFQILLIGLLWVTLAVIDVPKFFLFVFLPQMHGIHWLLGANYLQHAHADGNSSINFARNFTGLVNRVWFNIGFHTAHHRYPKAHWSKLRALHQRESGIDSRLVEPSLLGYMIRTFFLGLGFARLRSRSLMRSP